MLVRSRHVSKHFLGDDSGENFFWVQWNEEHVLDTQFSVSEIQRWRKFVAPGSVAIDIGAHGGDTGIQIAAAGARETIAFEVSPPSFKILEYNAGLNPHLRLRPHNLAVMHEEGTLYYQGVCNGCNGVVSLSPELPDGRGPPRGGVAPRGPIASERRIGPGGWPGGVPPTSAAP